MNCWRQVSRGSISEISVEWLKLLSSAMKSSSQTLQLTIPEVGIIHQWLSFKPNWNCLPSKIYVFLIGLCVSWVETSPEYLINWKIPLKFQTALVTILSAELILYYYNLYYYDTEAEIQLCWRGFQIPMSLPKSRLVGVEQHPTTKNSLGMMMIMFVYYLEKVLLFNRW